MKQSTQHVLNLLRAGPCTTGDFARNYAPRAAARICELRAMGYTIESRRERDNAYVFTLISEPDDLERTAGASPPPSTSGSALGITGDPREAVPAAQGNGEAGAAQLFEVPAAPRRRAWEDAA